MNAHRLVVLCFTLLLAACSEGKFSAQLVYPSQAAFDRGRTVELFVGEGFNCSELRVTPVALRLVFDSHGESPAVGPVAIGRVALLARVRDVGCRVFLDGCTETEIRRGVDNRVEISLFEVAGAGCGTGERCEQARCVAVELPDAYIPDKLSPDTLLPDTRIPDTRMSDTLIPDTRMSDTLTPDTLPSDTLPDTTAPDAREDGCINVTAYGAQPNDDGGDSAAFRQAFAAAAARDGGTVCVPDGVFLINAADASVQLLSNTSLLLTDHATLRAIATSEENFEVVDISDISNVEVTGGTIQGERYAHVGDAGRGGKGIHVRGATNVHIAGVSVADCRGDGIRIGDTENHDYSDDVLIENVRIENCRNNGIYVASAKRLTIRESLCAHSGGSGVDESGLTLIPGKTTQFLQDVLIENLSTADNAGYGIKCWLGFLGEIDGKVSVTISHHTDDGSALGAMNDLSDYRDAGYITVNP